MARYSRRLILRVLLRLLLLTVLSAVPASALTVEGWDSNNPTDPHNRWDMTGWDGTSIPDFSALNANPHFAWSGYDWSGVGWGRTGSPPTETDTKQSIAMISPRHFVGAYHFRPAALEFEGVDGTFSVSAHHALQFIDPNDGSVHRADVYVGELADAVPSSVKIYPVLTLGSDSDYVGREMVVYGWHGRVGLNVVDGFEIVAGGGGRDSCLAYDYAPLDPVTGRGDDETWLVSGDSGSPSFMVHNGELALVGEHFAHDPDADPKISYDGFVPYYVDQMSAILAADGYTLTTVPEPLTVTWIAAGLLLLVRWRRGRAAR